MFKKTIAVCLALIMLLSFAIIPAAAQTETVIQEADFEGAVEAAVGELIGADENEEVIVDKEFVQLLKSEQNSSLASSLAQIISDYIFINVDDIEDSDEIAKEIAENSTYTVKKVVGGKTQLYISVDLKEYPELRNLEVFQKTVNEIYEKQSEYTEENSGLYTMSYEHIAGELALHAIIYYVTDSYGGSKWYSPLYIIWKTAKVADLNELERRFPHSLMDAIGSIIMQMKQAIKQISAGNN